MTAAQHTRPGPDGHRERALLTDDDLVTGEAVALDIPAAGLGSRLASGLIDAIVVVLVLIMLILVLLAATANTDQALAAAGQVAATAGGLLILPATVETLTRGRSLGKLA
ncbi:MAG: RDD family protein, partial [Nocardioides sp.]|nr:RDD family protein [Nocardioides sp.]